MDTTDNGWDGPPPLCIDCGECINGEAQEHGLEGFGHHRRCCACYERRQRGLPATGKFLEAMMEWQGPIWNDCGYCNSVRRDVERGEGRRWCFWCERDAMERLRNLAHNLVVVAGYCASFELGRDYQHCIENAMSRHDEAVARRDEWYPAAAGPPHDLVPPRPALVRRCRQCEHHRTWSGRVAEALGFRLESVRLPVREWPEPDAATQRFRAMEMM